MELRTHILEYALQLEDSINRLLSTYLNIDDNSKTKNFGNKAGISFQSKIDLLFDIDVLTKDMHLDMGLQMNFRNKFLHDINCHSFLIALDLFDNGINNRFFKFLHEGEKKDNEDHCRLAYDRLCLSNYRTVLEKFQERRIQLKNNRDVLNNFTKIIERLIDLSFDHLYKIKDGLSNFETNDKETIKLIEKLKNNCQSFANNLGSDDELLDLRNKLKSAHADRELMKRLMK
ncbi:hypothetical protein [uncultured Aquimarina sp.]|uniref:hypothetical protein n=1 Tax=uncultured Aquimarina sp. TaxID=575652 RepID=UPI002602AF6C|nr:hypothetical protein [uncultured Aquimarina sp.]